MSPEPAGLPLPRRTRHEHLEPQLRERFGAGDATPFTAFEAAEEPPLPRQPSAAEAFFRGVERARTS